MSARELVVLGTASQAPTRTRNHVSAFLRFDDLGLLLDCGEGTQRQMVQAGVPSSRIDRLCITHAHGDHCLGLPGVLNRMALDGRDGSSGADGAGDSVALHCPSSAVPRLRLLTDFALAGGGPRLSWEPAREDEASVLAATEAWRLESAPLDHRVPAVGYRLVEADGTRVLPERLAERGVRGPEVAELQRGGTVRGVRLADVSTPRPGQRVAFVMDTRLCDGAYALAERADLLAVEATFLHRDVDLAERYKHLTARQAARLAREQGVRRLVLLHFSQRYTDLQAFVDEAGEEHDDVVVATDLQTVPVPPRG